ncbi:Bestrophin, RFP-TM, chloride channel-domain-containing protein [Sphaerosporella brunnea]|uniref:Bestrophin, RFP-TM, chloride channel-domain-containing protein n=1 Tax=Sphaerosporella brunnea TaxID=1250544 RepID=A0A5J5F5S7_9PEZI|nr:Bestrophin, RFP-TM, chloride channel-domain-containing protein [Sphaerosporella brunnea]
MTPNGTDGRSPPNSQETSGGFLSPPQSPKHSRKISNGTNGHGKSTDGGTIHPVLSKRTEVHKTLPQRATWDLDSYFAGPLDPNKHSRLPFFIRVHGSILPKLLVPLVFIAAWSTAIVVISKLVHSLAVDSLLLTVLGFVVALALSFRSTTAYERYQEGRKYWALLTLHSRQLAHVIWVHRKERTGTEFEKDDILAKLSAINLILAFAQACKHKLRHEIEYDYTDLKPLIDGLDTFAKAASSSDEPATVHNLELSERDRNWGEFLGIPFFESNPRKAYKAAIKAGKQHGNLPYEIIGYIGQFIKSSMDEGCMESAIMQGQVYNAFNNLMDAYGGCDRVLQTPLPLAYSIAISQITWLYVLVLPFQLYAKLEWVAIPGTIVAAYIILGLAAIGREIENPFGHDVNDLDLDRYCQSLQYDLNVLTSRPGKVENKNWMATNLNKPLWPYSLSGWNVWQNRSVAEIREALAGKVHQQAVAMTEGKFRSGEREEKIIRADV